MFSLRHFNATDNKLALKLFIGFDNRRCKKKPARMLGKKKELIRFFCPALSSRRDHARKRPTPKRAFSTTLGAKASTNEENALCLSGYLIIL